MNIVHVLQTLRKSASEQEKEEFLKEAILMKNFQHEHILGLLGVCLDNDPHFIIMELMEGGDLLTFLRSTRATSVSLVLLLIIIVVIENVYIVQVSGVHNSLCFATFSDIFNVK